MGRECTPNLLPELQHLWVATDSMPKHAHLVIEERGTRNAMGNGELYLEQLSGYVSGCLCVSVDIF
jgi:hypothetical protein